MHKKYRVVIRAFTCRRDVAPLALFAKILEREGCEVIIAGVRNFRTTIKIWKPHAVVINTMGNALEVAKYSPGSKIVYLDGEGFQVPGKGNADYWAENPLQFEMLDLAMVWGKKIVEECHEVAPSMDFSKLHVVGNPKLDLVRFLPEAQKTKSKKKSVGAVCRFPTINDHQGYMPVRTLPNEGNLERVIIQCKAFVALINAIEAILENTDLNVSIRPHPNEQLETYYRFIKPRFGEKFKDRIEIDDSLVFPEWAAQQAALLSPTSTSFLESTLLGVPVVNLDYLSDSVEFNKEYAPVCEEWQAGGLMPENLDQLCQILNSDLQTPQVDAAVEAQLRDYCDWYSGESACKNAADLVVELLKKDCPKMGIGWPTFLVKLRDGISFYRAMRENPLHHNFNYKEKFHKIPKYYDQIVDRIISGR